jgi:hypothetical protein
METENVSPMSRRAIALFVATYLIALWFLVLSPSKIEFLIGCGFIIANSIWIVPRCLWSTSIRNETIEVKFPLSPWLTRSFTADDITQIEIVRNPIFAYSDFIRLHFKSNKPLILPKIGNKEPEILEQYLQVKTKNNKNGEPTNAPYSSPAAGSNR